MWKSQKKSPKRVFYKAFLINFAKFIGKHLLWRSLLFKIHHYWYYPYPIINTSAPITIIFAKRRSAILVKLNSRSSRSQMLLKIGVLENVAKSPEFESLFNKVAGLEAQVYPTQVFSCEIYEFFKNTFFYRRLPVAASLILGQPLLSFKGRKFSWKVPVIYSLK